MSQSATPPTQNDMTTCLETFEKKRFCSFPNRHGDATGKPEIPDETRGTFEKERFCGFPHRHGEATGKVETRDETRGSTKTSISYETSGNFHSWQHDKRTGFAASPIDTAKPRENQRLETRHVRAPKHLQFSHFVASKSTFSYEFSQEPLNFATSKSMFRARRPSIFITSHKMPRLPRNLHLVAI